MLDLNLTGRSRNAIVRTLDEVANVYVRQNVSGARRGGKNPQISGRAAAAAEGQGERRGDALQQL